MPLEAANLSQCQIEKVLYFDIGGYLLDYTTCGIFLNMRSMGCHVYNLFGDFRILRISDKYDC